MSGKITDARVKELQALKETRTQLIEKIKLENRAMETIMASMSENEQELIGSSSREAKSKRNKGSSALTLKDQLKGYRDIVRRLGDGTEADPYTLIWQTDVG